MILALVRMVDEILVDEMLFDKMLFDEMLVDEMFVGLCGKVRMGGTKFCPTSSGSGRCLGAAKYVRFVRPAEVEFVRKDEVEFDRCFSIFFLIFKKVFFF
jgi:hypothetical protein